MLAVFIMAAVMLTGITVLDTAEVYAASAPTATASVTIKTGAYLRKSAAIKSKQLVFLRKGTQVVVKSEVFNTKKSTAAKKRWYYVTVNGKSGYLRTNWLGNFKYSSATAKAKAKITYRIGAGSSMTKKGSFKKGATFNVVLQGKAKGSNTVWYKVIKDSKIYWVSSKNVSIIAAPKAQTAATSSSKTSTSTSKTSTSTSKTSSSTQTANTTASTQTKSSTTASSAQSSNSAASSTKTTSNTTTQLAAAAPAPVTSGTASTPATVTEKKNVKPEFTLSDMRYPESLGEALPFSIMGKVSCNVSMDSAEVKILNSSGKTVLKYSAQVDGTTLDIKVLDKGIRFGTLTPGKYKYSLDITVGGKRYNQFVRGFEVRQRFGPDLIAQTAIALAYPLGTEEALYKYGEGTATEAFTAALNQVYPDRSKWGAAPQVGASCDVFAGTVCRFSGYDVKMPRGLGDMKSGQWEHLDSSPLWQEVSYSYKESDLRNGDIIIYQRPTGSEHICIYVTINGKGYLAEAAIKTYYGHISKITSGSKIFKSSDKKVFKVYRAAY